MTRREAKIIALETIAGNIDVLLNDVDLYIDKDGKVIRTGSEVEMIIAEIDIIAAQLKSRATKLINHEANN